eukprot:12631145-Ditylum_brightwellii.AAC.1
MAFYVCCVPRTMWAGLSSAAQQEKCCHTMTKRSSIALCNKMPSTCLQGCQQEGGGFLPTRAFLLSTSF